MFSPNAGKYGPEKLRIRILFTQWKIKKNTFDVDISCKKCESKEFIETYPELSQKSEMFAGVLDMLCSKKRLMEIISILSNEIITL